MCIVVHGGAQHLDEVMLHTIDTLPSQAMPLHTYQIWGPYRGWRHFNGFHAVLLVVFHQQWHGHIIRAHSDHIILSVSLTYLIARWDPRVFEGDASGRGVAERCVGKITDIPPVHVLMKKLLR